MKRPFRCLTIMVTNQCPLRCAHCGPRSGPWEKGTLHLETVIAALDEARARSCQVVNFSGGEPFILGQALVDMVRAASERGLLTRVTTGAYWSPTAMAAAKRLDPLAQAGLCQLFISCSDAHRVYVPLRNIIEATAAARSRGIQVYLVLGISKNSSTSSRTVRKVFEMAGIATPWLLESPLIPFGRAAETLVPDELLLQSVKNFAGPCPSLTEHPTIHADGRVTGCAVVFGKECGALSFGYIQEDSLDEILDRMDADPLTAWIHKIGVVELKQFIEANSSMRFADHYVNICHLCGDILGNSEVMALLETLGLGPRSTPRSADDS